MMRAKLPKAPFGCYWRGRVLWAHVQVNGQKYAWSLRTGDQVIASERRAARVKALRKPVEAEDIKRRVVAGGTLTAGEKAFVAHAIDLAAGKALGSAR